MLHTRVLYIFGHAPKQTHMAILLTTLLRYIM